MRVSAALFAALFAAGPCLAQPPAPSPIPRVKPRAHWVLTPGVTGTFSQRRENPGAASRDRMYVFGGRAGNATTTALNALYEFDGKAWTLKTAEGAPGSPPARSGACVAWNHFHNKLVVFGGFTGGSSPSLLGDTWEWDPVTNAWTQLKPAKSPTPRRYSSMSYEPKTKGMILFGGNTDLGRTTNNETWLLLNGNWIALSPPTQPVPRCFHSLMYRPDFMDVVMCSGADRSASPELRFLDVWVWNATDWRMIKSTTPAVPHGTLGNYAVYDEARKRIVVQGGNGISTYGGSTLYGTQYGGSPSGWCSEFDCLTNSWQIYGPSSFNTADPVIGRISRYFAAYIPALGKIYKVSGQNPSGQGTITGTCEYQAVPIAGTVVLGKGCQGLALTPTSPTDRPWMGRTYTATATGLATGSFPFGLLGITTQQIPLNLVHPAGVAGCNLEVGLNLVQVLNNTGGSAAFSLPIPVDSVLVGGKLHHQVLQVELTGAAVKALTSTNALSFTIGAL